MQLTTVLLSFLFIKKGKKEKTVFNIDDKEIFIEHEWRFDTEQWNNDWWKFSFSIIEKYILKYIKIENLFLIAIFYPFILSVRVMAVLFYSRFPPQRRLKSEV